MFGLLLIVCLVIYLAKDAVLFPYVGKSLHEATNTTDELGNVHLHQNTSSDEVTIFFPGNAMAVYDVIPILNPKKNYILVNYRPQRGDGFHYGFSNARVAIRNGYHAYLEAVETYREIHVVTFSIGNGVFSEILKKIRENNLQAPASLTSLSGICNLTDVVQHLLKIPPWVTIRLFPYFQTQDIFRKSLGDIPYTMVHGTNDEIISVSLAKKMYKKLDKKHKVTLTVIDGRMHNQIDLRKYL